MKKLAQVKPRNVAFLCMREHTRASKVRSRKGKGAYSRKAKHKGNCYE